MKLIEIRPHPGAGKLLKLRAVTAYAICARRLHMGRARMRDARQMQGDAFMQSLGRAVMALTILTSCTAQTTTAFRPSNQSTTAFSTGVSEIKDRNNFRDEQQAAPRANNAPIDP